MWHESENTIHIRLNTHVYVIISLVVSAKCDHLFPEVLKSKLCYIASHVDL